MSSAAEPCRTCDGTGFVETAPPDSRVIHQEPCPDCGGPFAAPVTDHLMRAVVAEYAGLLVRERCDPNRMPDRDKDWYVRGGRDALWRVAERLGVSDLHDQAAEVVAHERREGAESS